MLNRGMTIPVMVRNIPRANLNLKVLDSIKSGGAGGTRTPDPLLAKQVLSHLSYSPVPCPRCPMTGVADSLQQAARGLVNETSSRAFLFGTSEMG